MKKMCQGDDDFAAALGQFETAISLNHMQHFSFSIAFILSKGLVSEKCKENSMELLKLLNMIAVKYNFPSHSCIGLLVTLMTFGTPFNYSVQITQQALQQCSSDIRSLIVRYLVAIVSEVQPRERLAIFSFLKFCYTALPELFATILREGNDIETDLAKTLALSQDEVVFECSVTILKSMKYTSTTIARDPLKDCNMLGIKQLVTFAV